MNKNSSKMCCISWTFFDNKQQCIILNLNFIKSGSVPRRKRRTFQDEFGLKNNQMNSFGMKRNSRDEKWQSGSDFLANETYCFLKLVEGLASWKNISSWNTREGLKDATASTFLTKKKTFEMSSEKNSSKELKLHFQYLTVFNVFINWKSLSISTSFKGDEDSANRSVSYASQ